MASESEDKSVRHELYKIADARLTAVKTIVKRRYNAVPMSKVQEYIQQSKELSSKEKAFITLGLNSFPLLLSLVDVETLIRTDFIVKNNGLADHIRKFNMEHIGDFVSLIETIKEGITNVATDFVEFYRLFGVLLTLSHLNDPQPVPEELFKTLQESDDVVSFIDSVIVSARARAQEFQSELLPLAPSSESSDPPSQSTI